MSTFPNHWHARPPFLMDISLACCGQLVKILTTLEPYGILDQILHTYLFQYCPATGMQNSDEPRGFAEHHFGQLSFFSGKAHKLQNHMVHFNPILHTDTV